MKKFKHLLTSFVFVIALCTLFSAKVYAGTPMKVTNLRQLESAGTSVKLGWDIAPGCEENYYALQISYDGVNWGMSDSSICGCNTIIQNIAEGTTFYARVAAYDRYSWSSGAILGEYSDPIEIITNPADVTGVTQTGATEDSVTISWNPVEGASSYQVALVTDGYPTVVETADTCAVISGLAPNSKLEYTVRALKVSQSGFVAAGAYSSYDWYGQTTKIKTIAQKLSKKNIGIDYIYNSWNEIGFGCTKPENADGVQYEVRTVYKNKKVFSKGGTSSQQGFKYKKNVAYKYRARTYVEANGKKFYSAWSDFRYFMSGDLSAKKSGNSIKVTWKKASNVAKYTISISTAERTGYKKVKDVAANKNSLVVSKIGNKKLNKNQSYYIKIDYVFKDGKKNYRSDCSTIVKVY